MATKKQNPLLGPDGQAVAPIFGAIGKQFKRYMEYREKREKRIKGDASSTPPSSSTSTKGKTRKNGQKATLNGKPVVWKNGKWVAAPSRTVPKGSMNISAEGRKQAAANRAELKVKREKASAAASEASNNNSSKNSSTETKPTAPTKTKPKGKRDYGSTDKNLSAWAKAHPELARRLEDKKKAKAKKRAGGTLYSGRTGMSKIG